MKREDLWVLMRIEEGRRPYVSYMDAPEFTQEQIEFLKSLIVHTRISFFGRSITVMCSEETLGNVYGRILGLEEEMFRRGLIKKDYKAIFKPIFQRKSPEEGEEK